jgi:plasmid stabilization system protein ParE
LRFLPEVVADAIAAYSWYEQKAQGLGEEFLRSFYACANEVAAGPLLNAKVHGEFRRSLLRRFPYAVYYRTKNDQTTVCGVFHCARDPANIRVWLGERESE